MRQVSFFVALLLAALSTAHAYEIVPVERGGSVEGAVRLVGAPPDPQKVTITKDTEVCGNGARLVGEVAVDGGGSLKGAVVYVDKIATGKAWPESPNGFVIDQKGCRFLPSTLVMRKGDDVRITNKDKVLHNVHAYERVGSVRRTMFNRATLGGKEIQQRLEMQRGNEVKLECDAHNFMHESFLVLDHPYFSITTADGRFSIGDVPPGDYKLTAWHPALGRQEATVEVKAGEKVTADFSFKGK